jgi:hypothetical protein
MVMAGWQRIRWLAYIIGLVSGKVPHEKAPCFVQLTGEVCTVLLIRRTSTRYNESSGREKPLAQACLSGPSGFPRDIFGQIGTGLDGHPSHSALDFHPENRPGPKFSLGG